MKAIKRFAFFDVDETLIYEKSMFSIISEINKKFPYINPVLIQSRLQKMRDEKLDRSIVNIAFYRELKGLLRSDVVYIAREYFNKKIKSRDEFIIRSVVTQLETYRLKGYYPVFVSGSATDFIFPLAEYLNVKYCLATELKLDADGKYTGEIAGGSMIGPGKREAIINFLSKYSVSPLSCAGFGDHLSDLDFLELIGEPHIVANGDSKLVHIANDRNWPVIYP